MTSPLVVDVLIPAFNEGPSIGSVVRNIPSKWVRRVIVCNNNSTDSTAIEALKAGAIVTFQPKRGYGSACLAGISYIDQDKQVRQPDVVVFMDGDFSDYPDELPKLLQPIADGKDLVIGSRTLGNAAPGSLTIPQRFGNWLATGLIRLFYGFRFTDLGPFRAIRWEKLLLLKMEDPDFGWTVEMQVKALKHQLACAEVPVSYRRRIGRSKISGTVKGSILAGYKILWTIFRHHFSYGH
jgi:glycosyltransferase involved in cell wall biosynthesis